MLSIADIPIVCSSFTDIIGIVLWKGREYRIATYLGAKVMHAGNGQVKVKQGECTLTVELFSKRELPLNAPICGNMIRLIRESPSCHARYRFTKNDKVLFDLVTDYASFEYEYDK